jgi:hypothetical protein
VPILPADSQRPDEGATTFQKAHIMKTYAEECNEPPFDWNAALDKIIARGWAEPEEVDTMEDLANDWVTCACGNQCAIIPRDYANTPRDERLRHLGVDFTDFVGWGEWRSAKVTLQKIEARSAELIAIELAKQPKP